MNDLFELPVTYKDEELLFPARLLQYGYSYKIQVDVYGQEILFEPDEERNYRAVIDPEMAVKQVDVELLKEIAGVIEGIVNS